MLKVGHRGAMGYAPENTMASFAKALELDVDVIELDVHLCKSGEAVVIHDQRLDRTTNGKGLVSAKTLRELKSLDAGKGQTIPTLREVIEGVNKRAVIDIELKAEGTAGEVAKILQEYIQDRGWEADRFMLSSFDHHELMRCHALLPRVPFGPIFAAKFLDYARFAREMQAHLIKPFFEFLDEAFVRDAHNRGLKVITWTVNLPEDMRKMAGLGVDGMVSNYPDRICGTAQ